MRLIDADALKNALIECTPYAIDPVYRNTNSNIDMFTAMEILDELPTIDAVPVVRCRECKSHGTLKSGELFCGKIKTGIYGYYHTVKADDYCSYGERKEDRK
jgi:hypothetical protein